MDFTKIEERLNRVKKELNEVDKKVDDTIKSISKIDDTKLSYDILYQVLSEDEKEYHRVNEAYKKYISQYSTAYIEMSEWYYGPELPYDIYLREIKKGVIRDGDTYLDTPSDVREMYKLFIFFMMYDFFTRNANHFV
tara:strand:+ start:800 stop:1210 length:411 start_codon:yes stop_codon:yes gene_type:complete